MRLTGTHTGSVPLATHVAKPTSHVAEAGRYNRGSQDTVHASTRPAEGVMTYAGDVGRPDSAVPQMGAYHAEMMRCVAK